MGNSDLSVTATEAEKLAIEREKLVIEREKLEVEKYKARWSAIGVSVPILVVAATVSLGIWSQYQKGRDEFALKAAEILLAGDSPDATSNKAIALSTLFPNQLPPNFGKTFDPSQFRPNIAPSQKELLQLMATKAQDPAQILHMWTSMFPDHDWAKVFEKNLASNPSIKQDLGSR